LTQKACRQEPETASREDASIKAHKGRVKQLPAFLLWVAQNQGEDLKKVTLRQFFNIGRENSRIICKSCN
jgi:hypothetical protein